MDDWVEPPEDADELLEPDSLQPGPHDPILDHWLRFKPMFAELMEPGMWTLADLESKIVSQRAFFFPGKDSAMVGEIQLYPGGAKVMQIIFGVGDAQELMAMEPGILVLCRMLGCTALQIEGRLGWIRLLTPLGYKPRAVTLIKAV